MLQGVGPPAGAGAGWLTSPVPLPAPPHPECPLKLLPMLACFAGVGNFKPQKVFLAHVGSQ